ncbi:hypothetical protein O3M35_005958 [Rhynocoris fuscipes]|uniref:Uncharacterized protein n=1 Tax=Rhynocoris fuscipes TaxID=488301 RepID=A0AAW1DD70_9HEMI
MLSCSSAVASSNNLDLYKPLISSAYISNNSSSKQLNYYELFIFGKDLNDDIEVRLTSIKAAYGDECNNYLDYNIKSKWSNGTIAVYYLNISDLLTNNLYICVKQVNRTSIYDDGTRVISTLPNEVIKWVHQGEQIIVQNHTKYIRKRRYVTLFYLFNNILIKNKMQLKKKLP